MFCMTRAQQIEGGKQLSNKPNKKTPNDKNNTSEMRTKKQQQQTANKGRVPQRQWRCYRIDLKNAMCAAKQSRKNFLHTTFFISLCVRLAMSVASGRQAGSL